MTIPAMPISWIESYTKLSYFSMLGISLAMIGVLSTFGFCFD
jgi:hypothetical protein